MTVTVVAWASAFVVIRYAAHDIGPGALSLGRLLVGSLALSAMMIGRKLVRMSTREWALTALVGVAWFAVYSVALNAGEQHVDAGTASMLIQFAPILIGVLAGILLGEGFPRMLVIGGLVAFAGTLIIGFATSTGRGRPCRRSPGAAERHRLLDRHGGAEGRAASHPCPAGDLARLPHRNGRLPAFCR